MAEAKPSIEERISAALAPEETPQEAPQETPKEAEAQQEAPQEAPKEAPQEPEKQEEEDAVTVSLLSDLKDVLGVEESDLYNLAIPIGNGDPVPLSELKDSFVAKSEAKRFHEEAKAAREQARKEAEQSQSQYKTMLGQATALVDSLEKATLSRFQNVQWEDLRQSDPDEWAAKRVELQQAEQQIQQVKNHVSQQIQQYNQRLAAEQQESMQALLAKEREALIKAWPEMGNDKREAEEASLVNELKARGFSEQEISGATDHRLLLMARDAMRYRQSAEKADVAKKKVIKIGKKVVKPGSAASKEQANQDRFASLREKARKTGSTQDAAALISAVRQQR